MCSSDLLSIPKWMNVLRAVSSEGHGRLRYHTEVRRLLDSDPSMLAFLEGETDRVPEFYTSRLLGELGPLAQYLPPGGLEHDPQAYLKSTDGDGAMVALRGTA